MKQFPLSMIAAFLSILLAMGCSSTPSSPGEDMTFTENNKDFIIDVTGKEWDVSYARDVYGMKSSKFQFGLGPYAIPPIFNPKMLSKGDPGYPTESDDFLVLGTKLNGDARAYPLLIMSLAEIADDKFGDLHVAVAY